jgi:hypothetical protein
MDQGQSGQVNHTIKDLNTKLGELGSIIQRNGPALKMEQVTTIIPTRRGEGQITVSIETLKTTAQKLANDLQYGMPPNAQQDVNDLYDGLVKAIDVGDKFDPWKGGRRRTKRRNSKRRQSKKRRNTKRRRSSRK